MEVHCYLSHLRQPVASGLDPTLSAYRVSLETGDLHMGSICLCNYHWVYIFCGRPLGRYAKHMKVYLSELRLCHQDFLLGFMLPDLYLACQSENSLLISWDIIQEAESFTYKAAVAKEQNRAYTQLFNAVVLGDDKMMEQTIHSILEREKVYRRFGGSHMSNHFFTFWDGLACFALLRKRRNRTYLRLSKDSIKFLTRLAKGGSVDCVAILPFFLEAEEASLRRRSASQRTKEVKALYDKAIYQLDRASFLHYSAIANERAGNYMYQCNEQNLGEMYLKKAVVRFHQWGATVKLAQLEDMYPFLIQKEEEQKGLLRSQVGE